MATTIPEAVTTIPAGTLRLLLTSIGYRTKARKEKRRQAASGSARCLVSINARKQTAGDLARRALTADPVQVEILTHQQVLRGFIADTLSALASDLQTVGADLRRAGMVCAIMPRRAWIHNRAHRRTSYTYYNRRMLCPLQRPALRLVSSICWRCCGAVIRSSAAQEVHRRLVWLLYCVRWNGANQRKRRCKAL